MTGRVPPAATAPLVSVVVPAFNAAPYLREAVDSALAQDHRPLEVIVVDDGSTDGTARIARGYGSRIVLASQPNLGTAAARNRGVALATGALVAFLDADDVFLEGKIALQAAELARDPALDMVFSHFVNFSDPLPPGAEEADGDPLPGVLPGTLLVRRAALDRVGPFDESHRFAEFVAWLIRARELRLRERMLPQVLLRRRIHGGNKNFLMQDDRGRYVRLVKAALDRRRAAGRVAG